MAAELTTGTTYAGLMGVDTVSKEGYGYGHVYSQSGLEANDLLVALRGSNNSETVRAAGYLGGLAGFNSLRGTIDTSATGQWFVYSDNATTASTVGGIVGQNESNVTDKSVLDTVVNCAAVRRLRACLMGLRTRMIQTMTTFTRAKIVLLSMWAVSLASSRTAAMTGGLSAR